MENLTILVMQFFKCDEKLAKKIITGAKKSGTINDLIVYVRFTH